MMNTVAGDTDIDDYWKPTDPEYDPDLIGSLDKDTGMSNEQVSTDNTILGMIAGIHPHQNHQENLSAGNKGQKSAIKPVMKIIMNRTADVSSMSMFLRLKIKHRDDIEEILDTIQYAKAYLEIGGQRVFSIPNLTFNFLILEKLQEMGRSKDMGINYFNYEEWSEGLTEDEISNIVTTNNDSNTVVHHRYFVDDKHDMYLDIPLLFDFFSYGADLISLQYHAIAVELSMPQPVADHLKTLLAEPNMWLYNWNEVLYKTNEGRELVESEEVRELAVTRCDSHNNQIDPTNNRIKIYGNAGTKFLFVMIRSNEADIDVTGLPEIVKGNAVIRGSGLVELDSDMFYVADYDKKIRLYAISPDPEQDMRRWVQIVDEFKAEDHKQGMHTTKGNKKSIDLQFSPMDVDNIILEFSHAAPHIEVQTHLITQNILRILSGMAGLYWSN